MSRKISALLTMSLCVVLAVIAVWFFIGGADDAAEQDQPETAMTQTEAAWSPVSLREDPTVYSRLEAAPPEYFKDAAFVGNSLVEGLALYDYDGLLEGASFFSEDSITVFASLSLLKQLKDGNYGKVYLELGKNEISADKDDLRVGYESVVDTLKSYCPDSIIYLMAVPPVSREKTLNSQTYTRALVQQFNEMIFEIAREKGVWYLDVYSALSDEKGYLPEEVTADGVHFAPGHYEKWFDLLANNYVDENSPEEGA